ncbi:MAG: transcription antitermination factor NusB [bacterium]|nr:transcription antitermination factor NusB [bacterium]MDZ4284605.1 transcription antitermination factor NusB [Patescibacteria group bacterium]
MANRHLSRSIVLQSLFEWDFRTLRESDIDAIIARNAAEFAPGMGDVPFIGRLAHSIIARCADLDAIVEQAAPEWPLDKISYIDRNVLRIGLFELLFSDRGEVPAKVAINEAIELAKTFGGENSGKFVNGVLGAVYKELGEPGKDETSKRRHVGQDVPYDEMPLERLGGAVVYARDERGGLHLAFVHDVFGHWTLSKGKLEYGENETAGTAREIKEEIGLDIELKGKLGENEYVANDPEVGKKRKRVSYYLAEAPFIDLKLESSGGLDDARWFRASDIGELNFYEDIVPIITKAVNILSKDKSKARAAS